ncbi:MAG: sigma-70 family RNA polymerase sigma factor [Marinilabiliaceae bacterium]|nr:sigma-70 family RNA polymerase sigma factor [Marinilabiliaceae bacterium]
MSQISYYNRLIIKDTALNNFETIYKENYQKMYCIALNMINDRDAVCDIIQEIFIYYHKISQNGNTINNPKSWLVRATINKCIDHSKCQKKHLKIDSIEPIPIIDDSLEKNQEEKIIKQALSRLKPKEKTLALLYSEGMSYKEISELSGIKFSSVGKMLSRTIKKLDEILKKMNYEMY